MAAAVKYAGAAVAACTVSYGTYCLLSYAGSATHLRAAQSSATLIEQQAEQCHKDIQKTEAKIQSEAADAQKDEEAIKALKSQLKQKEAELDQVTSKLAETSQSLAKRLESVNQYRRASNDLRAKLTQNEAMQKDAAEKVTLAAERQRQVVSQLNPLNLPSVQALLGKR